MPCLKAFKDLHPFCTDNQKYLQTYYLYENRKSSARNNFDKIFNFKHILDKSKILIDIEQNLYLSSGMKGFLYFLLFSPTGELILTQRGYTSEIRDKLEAKIEKLILRKQ